MLSQSTLSRRTFERFCRIVRERAGIEMGAGKEQLIAVRVGRRLRALGIASADEYLRVLERDSGEEMVEFLNAISTNVTAFFREPAHFETLAAALRRWETTRQQRLFRLWSAAASSGEEPYSVAMTCHAALSPASEFRVLGTDISTNMLERALDARYPAAAVASVPPEYRDRYLAPVGGDRSWFEVCEDLRGRVIFERLNLAEPPLPIRGPVDCVLCRNVLMYLGKAVRQALVSDIERILRPGGLLMIGHAETLIGLQTELRSLLPSVFVKEAPCSCGSAS